MKRFLIPVIIFLCGVAQVRGGIVMNPDNENLNRGLRVVSVAGRAAVRDPSGVALLLGGLAVFGVRRLRSRRLRQQLCQLGIVGAVLLCAATVNAGVIHTATYNGHTYHLLDTDGTKWWLEAEAEAVSLGGHLVTINDAAENQWVYDTFGGVATTYAAANSLPDQSVLSLWIGFSDHVTEGTFVWSSGEAVTYTNWRSNEPAGNAADEDFVGMFVNNNPTLWHDIVGTDRFTDLTFGVVEINSIVPEPSSMALLLSGALVFGVRRFRSRRVRQRLCQLGIAGAVLLCAGSVNAGVIVYDVNQNSGLTGFNTAAGSPGVLVDFDSIAAGTDIGGTTISGMTFNAVGAPLIVVDGNSTTTPGGFSGVSNASTNKLYPTSGLNVLSPGGATLGPGFNSAVENDDLGLVFDVPVLAFGFDLLSQSQDGGSGVSVSVYNQSNTLLYSAQIPISSISGAGSPGGADFWGVMATGSDLIGQILIDESDQNASFPDANIGFDTFRVAAAPAAVPEPSSLFLLASGLSLLMLTRWKRARNVAVAATLVCCVVPVASAGVI